MTQDELSWSELDGDLLAELAGALRTDGLDASRRDAMRDRILGRLHAPAPDGTETLRGREMEWRNILPGVDMRVLRRDKENGIEMALYRMEPGSRFPPHEHAHDEECLVLAGEIHVGDHYVRAGDLHVAHAGAAHPVLGTDSGALLLIRSEIRQYAA